MKVNNQKPKEYCKMPIDDVLVVFKRYNLSFSKTFRMDSLKKVLEKPLQKQYNNLVSKARLGTNMDISEGYRMGRLKWHHQLSETQMEIELDQIGDEDLNIKYFKALWESLLNHILTVKEAEQIINDLNLLDTKKSNNYPPKIYNYNRFFDAVFYEEEYHLDGVHVNDFRKYVYQTSTVPELKIIGQKYEVSIPSSFSKDTLKNRLILGLTEKGIYKGEIVDNIDKATLKEIKVLLEQYGLNNRSYLNKEEMIEYILENSSIVKHLYAKPSESFSYGINTEEEQTVHSDVSTITTTEQNVISRDIQSPHITQRLDKIIAQQAQLIQLLTKKSLNENEEKKKSLLDKVYNYVIFTLIIIVAFIWIIYGVGTLLG